MFFWKVILFLLFLPIALLYHLTKLFIGRSRAHRFFYHKIVAVSAKVLSLNIPTLKEKEPFSVFSSTMKKALNRMPFETIEVVQEDEEVFQIHVSRCQFTEVFRLLGMADLTKALCDGDVVFCSKYQPCIAFERHHTIEKGDGYCDHTFILKKQ